ncbi:hypothetical protein [Haloplanus pelagicus]|uniref:hypothetical protein n=1 Tax=Haloplanus pelagicus TaxID=2949995 RepID=UPI00203D84B5|nr:hypothetical protein [Haloplanus sp. HW8-1]
MAEVEFRRGVGDCGSRSYSRLTLANLDEAVELAKEAPRRRHRHPVVRGTSGSSGDFSGHEIVGVLTSWGYKDRQRGIQTTLKDTDLDTAEVERRRVLFHDRVKIGTFQSIAEQCGTGDFDTWCRWIDGHR